MDSYSSSSIMVVEYAKATKNVCMCVVVSIILIILFVMSPLNSFFLSSIFGKIIILILLGYTIYTNIIETNKFMKSYDISLISGSRNPIKKNIICSYIFTIFLLVLAISVIIKFF
jgi:hypothetical protein